MEIHLCIPIEYKVNSFLSHSLIDAPIPVATEILIYIIDDNDTAIWQWPNCFTIIHRLHGKGTGFRQLGYLYYGTLCCDAAGTAMDLPN